MPQPTNATDDQRLHLAGAALLFGMAVLLAGLAYVQVVTALEHEANKKTNRAAPYACPPCAVPSSMSKDVPWRTTGLRM